MEGKEDSSSVRQLIIRVSDLLAAGEIRLIEVDPEEAAAAKARLDEVRKKTPRASRQKEIPIKYLDIFTSTIYITI